MDLHDHAGAALLFIEDALHLHHAELDQVGRRALHGRVDGGAFGAGAARPVGRVDFGQVEPATKHGADIALCPGLLAGALHVVPDARIALEIARDVVFGRRVVNAQVARQAKGAHAVDQAEVDHLGKAALFAVDLLHRHAEHLGGGGAVYVEPFVEGAQQGFVLADVRHDAQLDLAVVCTRDQAARRGHEGFAHTPAFGRADRDVLQVGVVARQASGHGHGLRVMGVHAPGARQRELGKLVGVGALELGQAAVLQDLGRQRKIFGQLLQHLFIGAGRAGGGLLDHRQAELAKKNLADLLGTAQIEDLPGQRVGLGLEFHDALAQRMALRGQGGSVYAHAIAFNAVKRLAAVDFQCIDVRQASVSLHLRPQVLVHAQGLVGVFAGVFGGFFNVDLIEADLAGALAAQVLKTDAAAPQVAQRQAGQTVGLVHFQHVALQHGVVHVAAHLDAMVGKHMAVVLDVLAELGRARILQPGPQPLQYLGARQLVGCAGIGMGQRDVGRRPRADAQADADDFSTHFVQRRGFGVQCREFGGADALQPDLQLRPLQHRFIAGRTRPGRGRRALRRIRVAWSSRTSGATGNGRRFRGVEQARVGARNGGGAGCSRTAGRSTGQGAGWGTGAASSTACHRLAQRPRQTLEAKAGVETGQAGHVRRCRTQCIQCGQLRQPGLQVAVGLDGQQRAPGGQPVQRAAQVLADHALDGAGLRHHRFQRAVFAQPLHRRLGADLVNAGHVVYGIAHQCLVVQHQVRGHAEFSLHAGEVAALVVHGVQDQDALVDQLRQVLVAAADDHVQPLRGSGPGQRTDHVIGLHAGHVEHFPAEQTHDFVDRLDLAAQVVGHGGALGLVLRIQGIAEGRALGVKDARHVGRRHILAQALQHVDHAANGASGRTGGVARHGAQVGHGVEGTVQIAGAIHQQQGIVRFAHACILPARAEGGSAGPTIQPWRFTQRSLSMRPAHFSPPWDWAHWCT